MPTQPQRAFALLAGALFLGLVAGCFIEREPPASFRYDCDGDGDCDEDERCISNLCQVPCSLATSDADCPSRDFAACINGTCATLCDTTEDEDPCSAPQSCTSLAVGGMEAQGFGLCMEACTEESCPDGEACLEGFCVQTCDVDDPMCAGEAVCVGGICIPDQGDSGGGFP